MKTPIQVGRVENQDSKSRTTASRRQRTLSAPACESLEGRKLMTGFAGAAGMAPAEVGDANGAGGGGRDMTMPRFRHAMDDAGTSTADSSQGSNSTANDGRPAGDGN